VTPTPPADDLYSLPLDEFTPARDELVKRLRAEGKKDEATAVKALKKPSLPAWAVNQLARRESDAMARLFAIRDELSDAQGARELRELSNERRRVLSQLVDGAGAILLEAGHSAAAATIDAVSKTLQAGGTDEERDRILSGTLERPLEPSGFEGLGGFEAFGAALDEGEEEPAPPSASARRKAEKLAGEAEEAEREAGQLAAAAERAVRAADEARDAAERAARRAEKLRSRADKALEDLGG
jgi:hypothetical protein